MWLEKLGTWGLNFCLGLGSAGCFLVESIFKGFQFKALIRQLHMVGVLSLAIIIVSSLFIGFVLGLQGYYTLSRFGASEALGQLLALSIVRELGPVITGLLFAGRAGSSLTSEIGLMKATEQLDSMSMMGVNPLFYIVSPRFWAAWISMPFLMIIFSACAVIGGYWVGVDWLGIDAGAFWSNMQSSVNFADDIGNGIIKSVVFGFVVAWIAVYQGYACMPTSEGIARATTKTVVYGSLCILGLDFILTSMMFK
jgi:phospholipid/cholesterol/gamma-HCH transport system permease protein